MSAGVIPAKNSLPFNQLVISAGCFLPGTKSILLTAKITFFF
jgi:hypothetical protein